MLGALAVAGIGLASSAIQYGVSKKKAKEAAKNRPVFETPAEVGQELTYAQWRAQRGLPEEQKQEFLSNQQRGAAFGLGLQRTDLAILHKGCI